VLEGSVRRVGSQVRVNTQLTDAEPDTHLWAERFDRDAGDLFALQDEITSRIAIALDVEMVAAKAARSTAPPDALDCVLRGRAANSMPPSAESYAEAINQFERALTLDPRSADAQGRLATTLVNRISVSELRGAGRYRSRGTAGGASRRSIASQSGRPFRQRPGIARAGWLRGGHSRI
jgi:hypothetical protein